MQRHSLTWWPCIDINSRQRRLQLVVTQFAHQSDKCSWIMGKEFGVILTNLPRVTGGISWLFKWNTTLSQDWSSLFHTNRKVLRISYQEKSLSFLEVSKLPIMVIIENVSATCIMIFGGALIFYSPSPHIVRFIEVALAWLIISFFLGSSKSQWHIWPVTTLLSH